MDIELTNKQHNKIKRAVKALNDVRAEVQQENPDDDINWYLEDCGNLNFMGGPTHDSDKGLSPLHGNAIQLYFLDNSSGGGW